MKNLLPNNNNKSKPGYYMIDSLSDEQLLELANHYITTDESLDNFQNIQYNKSKENLQQQKVINMKAKIETLNKINNSNKDNIKESNNKRNVVNKEIKYISDGSKFTNNKQNKYLNDNRTEILNFEDDEDIIINEDYVDSNKNNILISESPTNREVRKALEYYNNVNKSNSHSNNNNK